MTFRVLVTAGGTSEKIDDVRVITNISTGRFGAAISDALISLGLEVTLLRARTSVMPKNQTIRIRDFTSAAVLENLIKEELCSGNYDAVVMAAAVADYIPVTHVGKLPSDFEILQIEMKRRSKILPLLREWIGHKAIVVGFKLLSNASLEDLKETALKQLELSSLDLVVANDLKELQEDQHPILLCKRDRQTEKLSGSRDYVANKVALEIQKEILRTKTLTGENEHQQDEHGA